MIRTKKDVQMFVESFADIADIDSEGKCYFVFEDEERGGQSTLMKRVDGQFTVHGRGKGYCDEAEIELNVSAVIQMVWKYRRAINSEIRKRRVEVVLT